MSLQLGMADTEAGKPVTPGTLLPIGSVSKPMTAAVALLLAQDGLMVLDAPVRRYVSQFPHTITIRQLILHLGCIRHYRSTEWIIGIPYANLTDATEWFRNDPLVCEPGSEFSYSDYGYTLLGAAMESASGLSFHALMKERLLNPFRMKDTHPDMISSLRARSYIRAEGGIMPAPETNGSSRIASGGYMSNPEDLLRFAHGIIIQQPGS